MSYPRYDTIVYSDINATVEDINLTVTFVISLASTFHNNRSAFSDFKKDMSKLCDYIQNNYNLTNANVQYEENAIIITGNKSISGEYDVYVDRYEITNGWGDIEHGCCDEVFYDESFIKNNIEPDDTFLSGMWNLIEDCGFANWCHLEIEIKCMPTALVYIKSGYYNRYNRIQSKYREWTNDEEDDYSYYYKMT